MRDPAGNDRNPCRYSGSPWVLNCERDGEPCLCAFEDEAAAAEHEQPPTILNPDAVGDPDQNPVVQL